MLKKAVVGIAALLLFLTICVVSMPTAHYVVKPVPPGTAHGSPRQLVPVPFWNLGVRGMAITIAMAYVPILLFPVELFFALKIFISLAYWKITQNALFDNSKRHTIFNTIRNSPGISFSALRHSIEMAPGIMEYHLTVLKKMGRVVSVQSGKNSAYFENTGKFSAFEKILLMRLRESTARKIVEILLTEPEVSRKDIAGKLKIAGPSVSWHTNQLSRDGIITVKKEGVYSHYALSKEANAFLQNHQEVILEKRTGNFPDNPPKFL